MNCCNYNNHNKCKTIKIISIFALIFLVIALLLFITINNQQLNKNILVAIASGEDNTSEGNVIINFGTNEILEGTALSHTTGSSEILINEDGIYKECETKDDISKTLRKILFK